MYIKEPGTARTAEHLYLPTHTWMDCLHMPGGTPSLRDKEMPYPFRTYEPLSALITGPLAEGKPSVISPRLPAWDLHPPGTEIGLQSAPQLVRTPCGQWPGPALRPGVRRGQGDGGRRPGIRRPQWEQRPAYCSNNPPPTRKSPLCLPYLPPPLPLRPFNSSSHFKKGRMGVKTEGSDTCSQPVTQVAGGTVLSGFLVIPKIVLPASALSALSPAVIRHLV